MISLTEATITPLAPRQYKQTPKAAYDRRVSSQKYQQNKERHRELSRKWRAANKGRHRAMITAWQQRNKKRIAEKAKLRYQAKREQIKQQTAEYRRRRYESDPVFRIRIALSTRLVKLLGRCGASKSDKTIALLGCSLPQLKAHIESQFKSGMTWENKHLWEVDHIKPCAAFDLSDPEQQRKCFHFTNLQPLWSEENRKKSSTYEMV